MLFKHGIANVPCPLQISTNSILGNDQEMAQLERYSHSINRGLGKNKITLRYVYQENIS